MKVKETPLYEYSEKYKNIMESPEADENGEITEEWFAEIESIEGEWEEKLENVVYKYKNVNAYIDSVKAEIEKYKQKLKTAENASEGIKNYIDGNMKRVGKDKVKTATMSLSYRTSSKTVIDDEAAIPEAYKTTKTEISVDKTAIKKAISAGENIPGAHIEESMNLQIK